MTKNAWSHLKLGLVKKLVFSFAKRSRKRKEIQPLVAVMWFHWFCCNLTSALLLSAARSEGYLTTSFAPGSGILYFWSIMLSLGWRIWLIFSENVKIPTPCLTSPPSGLTLIGALQREALWSSLNFCIFLQLNLHSNISPCYFLPSWDKATSLLYVHHNLLYSDDFSLSLHVSLTQLSQGLEL